MEVGHCVKSVRGTTHQARTMYSEYSKGKQCCPIAYFAILYTDVVDVSEWTSNTVDFLLDFGD